MLDVYWENANPHFTNLFCKNELETIRHYCTTVLTQLTEFGGFNPDNEFIAKIGEGINKPLTLNRRKKRNGTVLWRLRCDQVRSESMEKGTLICWEAAIFWSFKLKFEATIFGYAIQFTSNLTISTFLSFPYAWWMIDFRSERIKACVSFFNDSIFNTFFSRPINFFPIKQLRFGLTFLSFSEF